MPVIWYNFLKRHKEKFKNDVFGLTNTLIFLIWGISFNIQNSNFQQLFSTFN